MVRPQEDWAPEGTSSWGDWDPGAATGPVDCLHPAARWIHLVHIYIPSGRPPSCSARGESWMRPLVLFVWVLSVAGCV